MIALSLTLTLTVSAGLRLAHRQGCVIVVRAGIPYLSRQELQQ